MGLKMQSDNKIPEQCEELPGYERVAVRRWQQGSTSVATGRTDALDQIAQEIPVAMVYNGISHVVMMASPKDLEDFALGFSLTEQIIQTPDEIYGVEIIISDEAPSKGIELHITISAQRANELKLRRRNLTGRTGCGLCGAESLQQALRPLTKVTTQALPDAKSVDQAVRSLSRHQPLQALTGAFHGAAWCDLSGAILLIREDVGRHNALDKLLGAMSQLEIDKTEGFLLISSRASYEMVHKSASQGLATLVAVSAPTALALELAAETDINLIGFARNGRHVIYHQAIPDRIEE